MIPIDPCRDARWAQYILAHENATIFHHPRWMRVLQSTYEYKPMCWAAVENSSIAGILPVVEMRSWLTGVRGACLPFSDACAPLADTREVADRLVAGCCDLVRTNQWRYLEIRGSVDRPSMRVFARYKWHVLLLDRDSQKLFQKFKKTQIQQRIAKASREGVTIERRRDIYAMREFVRLNTLTRKKLGVPPQPDRFFFHLHEELISNDLGFVSLAMFQNVVIAAAVFLHFKSSLMYKYSASDESFLRQRPNNLIIWDAIHWGCENNYAAFDFGRTDVHDQGLLDFKRGWGAEERDLQYFRFSAPETVPSATTSGTLERLRPILQKVPIPILKLMGRMFYGHLG